MKTRILKISGALTCNSQKKRPKIRFAGAWLGELGFYHNRLVSIEHENETLIFRACNESSIFSKSAKVLNTQNGLLQVRYKKHHRKDLLSFEVKGKWLEDLGFTIGNMVIISTEPEILRVRVIHFDEFGFGIQQEGC